MSAILSVPIGKMVLQMESGTSELRESLKAVDLEQLLSKLQQFEISALVRGKLDQHTTKLMRQVLRVPFDPDIGFQPSSIAGSTVTG